MHLRVDLLVEHSDLLFDHEQLELLHEATASLTLFLVAVNRLTVRLLLHVVLLNLLNVVLQLFHAVDALVVVAQELVDHMVLLILLLLLEFFLGFLNLGQLCLERLHLSILVTDTVVDFIVTTHILVRLILDCLNLVLDLGVLVSHLCLERASLLSLLSSQLGLPLLVLVLFEGSRSRGNSLLLRQVFGLLHDASLLGFHLLLAQLLDGGIKPELELTDLFIVVLLGLSV